MMWLTELELVARSRTSTIEKVFFTADWYNRYLSTAVSVIYVCVCARAGYRHVYLEGMEEASIFVHVAVNDITSKVGTADGASWKWMKNLLPFLCNWKLFETALHIYSFSEHYLQCVRLIV